MGALRSATSARSIAATSASTSACASSARASSASRPSRFTPETPRARGVRAPDVPVRLNGEKMIHPIPSGTRDVLPDETREVRAITDSLRSVFERHGYGEVYTPALEYEAVLARPDMAGAQPPYRVFDETGAVLVLRSDMTVPIARVVATRYPKVEPPLRFCYFAHCYRGVRPQRGQPRELLQAGIELIGAPAPQGTAEALGVLCRALDATGLKDYRVGLGDASLYPALMAAIGISDELRPGLLEALARRDFVELGERLAAAGLRGEDGELLLSLPQRRGGAEVLAGANAQVQEAGMGGRRGRDL